MTRARDVADTQDNVGGSVAPFVAGKNKIINGDFGIWQRGTSFSVNNGVTYSADRWVLNAANAVTVSQQTFTPGSAPVAGYEGTFFARFNRTSRPTAFDDYFIHRIEDVRTFAGQTITYSFWAKSTTNSTLSGAYLEQWFGSGGSASPSYVDSTGPINLTTSWQRYTKTTTIPSVAGKTIGTSSFLSLTFGMGNAAGTSVVYDIWGVQIEAGNVATPFTTATGNPASELVACQRYYYREALDKVMTWIRDTGLVYSVNRHPVQMRVSPTASSNYTTAVNGVSSPNPSAGQLALYGNGWATPSGAASFATDGSSPLHTAWYLTGFSVTLGQSYTPVQGAQTTYIEFSAEL